MALLHSAGPRLRKSTAKLEACAVQLLLDHRKVDSTVRYFDVELEDALSVAERIDI